MMDAYVQASAGALAAVLALLVQVALPLAIGVGMVAVASALAFGLRQNGGARPWLRARRSAANVASWAGLALLVAVAWSALKATGPAARSAIEWRESAEATANPTPDARPVTQYGPALAVLTERTYTRTLTLPPDFLTRIGAEGVGVLSPYLTDPSAENVLRLVDTFRRSGRDVVFTRQVTRLDEVPIPFVTTAVKVRFRRLPGRAYESAFDGRYVFANSTSEPVSARFLFPLPEASTVRDRSVTVDGAPIAEPNTTGAYEWKGELSSGQVHEAVVRYGATGTRTWNYDMGSARRRVQQFQLDAEGAGGVRFLRGSLKPNSKGSESLHWQLGNVITAQRIALSFAPDTVGRDCYLQALSVLPASLALCVLATLSLGPLVGLSLRPGRLAVAVAAFAFGLGAAPVLVGYTGALAGLLAAPLAGALMAGRAAGWRSMLAAVPAALVPPAFLSPEHTGLLLAGLVLAAAGAILLARASGRMTGAHAPARAA